MRAYIRQGAWLGLYALLASVPVSAQSAAASDGVQRSAGPADPSDNLQYVAGPADPSDDLYPAGKHALPAVEALPPLGAAGEAGPYLFGLSENDIIAAALAAKPDRVDLDLVLERMRKPFDASRFGTLHHAVGEDGVLRLQHRAWELRLAGVPRDVARREVAQQIDRERDAYFVKRYPHGVPDDDPFWGVIVPAGGSLGGAGTDGGCSTGTVTTTQDASRSWRLTSESYVYNVAGDSDWYSCSYALLQHRWRVIGAWMPWDGHKAEEISIVQCGNYTNVDPPSGVPLGGRWRSWDEQYDSKSAFASKFWDFIPDLWSWTSEATATHVEFGELSAKSCAANW